MAFLIGVGGMTLAVIVGTYLLLYVEKKQKEQAKLNEKQILNPYFSFTEKACKSIKKFTRFFYIGNINFTKNRKYKLYNINLHTMKKKVGQVTTEEKNEILSLFERKNGLSELAKILKENDALYEKMVTDMGETSTKFQNWWNRMETKYQWEGRENGHWEIDFDANEIYLCF